MRRMLFNYCDEMTGHSGDIEISVNRRSITAVCLRLKFPCISWATLLARWNLYKIWRIIFTLWRYSMRNRHWKWRLVEVGWLINWWYSSSRKKTVAFWSSWRHPFLLWNCRRSDNFAFRPTFLGSRKQLQVAPSASNIYN